MESTKFPLGTKVRDVVSGWRGVTTARIEYLNGCVRYQLEGPDHEGQPVVHVFDEEQLEVVHGVAPVVTEATRTGGDRDAPASRPSIVR